MGDDTEMWHKRLGHIGMKGLQELSKQGILDPKRINNLDFCERCVMYNIPNFLKGSKVILTWSIGEIIKRLGV